MRQIELANQQALDIMLKADPVLIDVVTAEKAIPALAEGKKILHAGPPIEWARLCGPMQGAVAGIAVFEGWAENLDDAVGKAASGEYEFHPNHHFDAVGPMTGMTTRSQPLMSWRTAATVIVLTVRLTKAWAKSCVLVATMKAYWHDWPGCAMCLDH